MRQARVLEVGREDLDRVAAHAERAADEVHVAALVLLGDEIGEQRALVEPVADLHLEGHGGVGLDRADTVDAGHRGDDDDVVALQQRARRRVAHAVDLLVDRGFLLDKGVGARDVGLRLVVVVVGDEILDRVVREELLELGIELRGERLVGREDQRRALRLLDHLGHGEGLAGAGDAEQHLGAVVLADAGDEIADGGRLVAGRLEIGDHPDRLAAFGLFRAGRAVRHPELAVLVQRIAGFDQRREGGDGGGDAGVGQRSASSSEMSRPATGLRPAAARSFAVAAPPIEVPRAVLVGAEERSGMFLDLAGLSPLRPFGPPPPSRGRRSASLAPLPPLDGESPTEGRAWGAFSASLAICSAQSEIEPVSGAPVNPACGASAKPLCSSGSEASR